ncbi:DUF4240 domain-containing protein [Streptomyces sp. NPDC005820]|uniref:DUF4240 domain-containing protein n=1 Tax=Streptomyces sp. NPDC005820 TaxID=3157069 RepID=UPI0033ED8566
MVGDRADDREMPDDPLPEALVDILAALEPAEIIDFYVKYVEVEDSAHQYSLCMAAYLIEGSYTNDGFMDFRGGLILLGYPYEPRGRGLDWLRVCELFDLGCIPKDPRGDRLTRYSSRD